MGYKITDIEGIGPASAEKLETAKITTTDALLSQCGTSTGRKTVADHTGVSEKQILDWTNMADMMRVSGVGGQFAELLKAAGVDTVKELATRNADNHSVKMTEINNEKHLTKGDVSAPQVQGWIDQSKGLDPVITHQH